MPSISPTGSGWERLLEAVRLLRGPAGCPWDRAQTAASLAGHLVEEAYEVLHSARSGAREELAEEIGDVVFLIALVRQELEERGGPSMDSILESALEKIVRRHPHVFGGAPVEDAREASRLWERIKRTEKGEAGEAALPSGTLPEPPPALPALLQAQRIQEKAAAVGFDWPDAASVLPKIREEVGELDAAMAPAESDPARVREEAGDLLFAVVNLARALGLDAEEVLRDATGKFRRRFNRMAELAAGAGRHLHDLDLDAQEELWRIAKGEEAAGA